MTVALEQVTRALADEAITAAMGRIDTIASYDAQTMGEADSTSLIDLGTLLTAAAKRCEAQEKATLGDSDRALEKLHEPFRRTRKALAEAITACRFKLGAHKAAVSDRAAKAEKERQTAAAAAQQAEEQVRGIALPPVANAAERGAFDAPAPANKTVAGVGTSTTRKLPAQFTVVDKAAAFAEYPHLFVFDQAAARLELRAAQARDPNAKLVGLEHVIPTTEAFGTR